MDFYEKIKALRIQRGLTLQAVGDLVGVGKSTVRKWENGDIKNMGRDKIELLAKALGVDPGYLMGWDENEAVSDMKTAFTSGSKKWRMLSEGLEEFERTNNPAFDAIFQFLTTTYPDTFKERNDDDDPES